MGQDNNTTKSTRYKHLTERNRYKIEILLKEKLKPLEIAQRMKKGMRTIEREIALDALEIKYGRKFKEKFKTITVDNGSEFLDFKGIEESLKIPREKRVKVYYAHPYSSWERGTNENSNKLIRRFIPKGTGIGNISKIKIKYIETWMNNYPRKILGYKSAKDAAG